MISIILVEPENPDNIGAAARALKNMGLSDLRLVRPPRGWKKRGKKMAMSAWDVLQKASVFKTLEEASADLSLMFATTRRTGARRGRFVSFNDAVRKAKEVSETGKAAFVFGKESKGLDNKSLNFCDGLVSIPSSSAYPSLNLAQAVMTVVFSLYTLDRAENIYVLDVEKVPKQEVSEVLEKFDSALKALGYERTGESVMRRIRNTFHGFLKRGELLRPEAQMFKGFFRRIAEKSFKK